MMIGYRSGLMVLAAALFACTAVDNELGSLRSKPDGRFADVVLTNGVVHTLDENLPRAESIALRNGEVTAIGESAELRRYINAATRVVDLKGQAVLPGFFDLHVHPIFAGLQARRCVIAQGADLAELQRAVKACAQARPAGEWIRGGQWDVPALGQAPTAALLDQVAPDHPVFLGDTSEHSAWANSLAMKLADIDETTPDPEGGVIERDAAGRPTGVVHESATLLIDRIIPEEDDDEVRAALAWGVAQITKYGITSFTEASTGYSTNLEKELRAYAEVYDEGLLKQRVRLCMRYAPGDQGGEAVIRRRAEFQRDRIKPDCVKLMLDGVPTLGRTAAMLEPYDHARPGNREAQRRGLLMVDQSTLNDAVTKFDAQALTVKMHAAGDAAVRAALTAIESARAANGDSGLRHNPAHCTFVAADDMSRGRQLGASFELSPYLWSPSPINDSIAQAVGQERIRRVWPFRDLLDAGALVVPGSDWSVVPSANPWIAIETLVTRKRPGGIGEAFGAEQAITVQEAIELFTVNASRHMGTEDSLGRLLPGMQADLIVLDRDPFATPSTELHKVSVKMTVIGGEIVWQH